MRVGQEVRSEPEPDGVRVVAVDSRSERRHVMRRLLELWVEPAEIGEADSREVAIELVGRCRPEVVVLEIAMPLQEGLDTITALRLMSPAPRIVVCSFHHDAVTVQAARDRGADAYVNKPVGSAELRAALGVSPGASRRPGHGMREVQEGPRCGPLLDGAATPRGRAVPNKPLPGRSTGYCVDCHIGLTKIDGVWAATPARSPQ